VSEWNILTVTRGGTVSLLKNLTEEVARETMQRLTPWYRRPDCPRGRYSWRGRDSDLEKLEAFGPQGIELVVWPKTKKPDSN
jgi:hypothetical protein